MGPSRIGDDPLVTRSSRPGRGAPGGAHDGGPCRGRGRPARPTRPLRPLGRQPGDPGPVGRRDHRCADRRRDRRRRSGRSAPTAARTRLAIGRPGPDRPARTRCPARAPPGAARRPAQSLQAGRCPGRRPGRAEGDHRQRAGGDRPAPGQRGRSRGRHHRPSWPTSCARRSPSGSTGSTRCPRTSATGSVPWRSTTSSSPRPASALRPWSSGCDARSSTAMRQAWPTPSAG